MITDRIEAQSKSALEVEHLAAVFEWLIAHQDIDNFDTLFHARERRGELHAMKMLDHLRSTGAETNNHASTREFVQCGEVLRERRWRTRISVDDSSPELNLFGAVSQHRKNSKCVSTP